MTDEKPSLKPNFFILGAAKSGTTSLFHCLEGHPEVFIPPLKETNFFSDGFQGFDSITRATHYFERMGEGKGKKRIGEGSHSYLTSPRAAKTLKLLFPDCKLLVILRNPADRGFSLYHHLRRLGYEKYSTFEKALEAEEWRMNDQKFIDTCGENIYNVMYFRSGFYGEQIQRYQKYFDADQLLITTFDKLIQDSKAVLSEICEFLEIDYNLCPGLPSANKGSVTARFPWLNHFFSIRLGRIIFPVDKPLGIKDHFKKHLFVPKPKLNPDTKRMLMEKYADDQALLHELTGIRFE